ncbi:MAG TPA: polyribonucleotide nucleotidyltransferase [Candidatus Brocadiia bacterium]|nr:polyribonucleotide nucleotidyltransferase [Candidatus Brocadiia bacterium]
MEVRRKVGASEFVARAGEYGGQADACITLQYGKTMVLCAVVDGGPVKGDFMPLLVDYRERFYAAGRILGSRFMRRESKPKDNEVLTSRMMDRSIRPFFPDGYRNDTQLTAILMASDGVNPSEPVAVNAAMLALSVSGIPVTADLACVCVAKVNGEYVVFPTEEQLEAADFEATVSCSREKVVMIEFGGKPAPEAEVCKAIETAHAACRELLGLTEEMKQRMNVTRRVFTREWNADLEAKVKALAEPRILAALEDVTKESINDRLHTLSDEVVAEVAAEDDSLKSAAKEAFEKTLWAALRRRILSGKRDGGRSWTDIRPITSRVAVLPCSHGSAMFKRGQTQVLSAVTLGGYSERQLSEQLHGEEEAPFMLHYNFPGFSVGEVRPERGPGRRDIGHGHLALKALAKLMPDQADFPYTVRVVAEVLESCASSSMATVCASSLALMDAGVPIKEAVAGISIGMVTMDNQYKMLTDIYYLEDAYGDMDFKVAGTANGVTAIQVDVKNDGLTQRQVAEALEAARVARLQILEKMGGTLAAPRAQLSELAPRVGTAKIPADKIGMLIGPGGKNIRGLQEENACTIDVEEDGTVYVTGTNPEGFDRVLEYLRMMGSEPEVGQTYTARVVSVKDFGAFLEFLPGVEGLLHVSEIDHSRVDNVEDFLKVGDQVKVKLVGLEREGKFRLSRKALIERPDGMPEPESRPERTDRGDRGGDRRGGDRRGGRDRDRGGRDRDRR